MKKPCINSSAERKARGRKPYHAPTIIRNGRNAHGRTGADCSFGTQHKMLREGKI